MATSGDSCACHNGGEGCAAGMNGQRTEQPPRQEKNPVPNVTSAEAEKP